MKCPMCKLLIDELWIHYDEIQDRDQSKGIRLIFFHGCKWDTEIKIIIVNKIPNSICNKIFPSKEARQITLEYSS